jgi:hypothetical protein
MFNDLHIEVQKKEFPPICTSHSNAAQNKLTKTPYRGVDKVLSTTRKETSYSDRRF